MEREYNLSQAQKRIWLSQKINPKSCMYIIGGYNLIYGKIDISLLKQAIVNVVESYDIFRMKFSSKDYQPVLSFRDSLCFTCEEYDFSLENEPMGALHNWINQKSRDISIDTERLFDFSVFKITDSIYGYTGIFHHIIADGWTMQVLSSAIKKRYSLLRDGNTLSKNNTLHYVNFIERESKYLRSERFKRDRKYWLDLISTLNYEKIETSSNLISNRKTYVVGKSLQHKIEQLCADYNVSISTLFLAIYSIFYHKVYGKKDQIIGVPIFGRVGRTERHLAGMCVNQLPCGIHLEGDMTVSEVIESIDLTMKNNFRHYQYPINKLMNELQEKQIYKTCINYYNTDLDNDFCGYKSEYHELHSGEQEYGLQLVIRKWKSDASMVIDVDYQINLYTNLYIESMMKSLFLLLDQFDETLNLSIAELELTDENYRKQFEVNYTPYNKNILETFSELVEKTPDKKAVCDRERELTYLEFDGESDYLASILQNKGISEGEIIGIWLYNSVEILTSIWGAMKAGIAYLPIEYNTPLERALYMLDDANVTYILCNFQLPLEVSERFKVITIDEKLLGKVGKQEMVLPIPKLENRLIYTIYTSGSTGKPKGVMIEEKALTNYIMWAKDTYITAKNEVFPLYSSISFDLTVTTIFLPLVCGGTIQIYDNREEINIVSQIVKDNKCTIAKFTPAHLTLLADIDNRECKLRKLIVGGENLTVDLCKRVTESFGKEIDIYNEYGPTEATVGCMIYRYDSERDLSGSVPIGKAIDNNIIYLLDHYKKLVPKGIRGEIYISGINVARSYLNRDDLTQESFLQIPELSEIKVYKTGDIAVWHEDSIVYLGRVDNQINLNGYRVELDEIDNHMMKVADFKWTKTIVTDMNKTKVLVTYYQKNSAIETNQVREALMKVLPNYCIPTIYVKLDKIPLTKNGKIDILKLPKPCDEHIEDTSELNEYEKVLLKAMENVMDNLRGDNFYYLGGDSIKAIQISSLLREWGYELKVKDILSTPKLREMANFISKTNVDTKKNMAECVGTVQQLPILKWFFQAGFQNKNTYCQMLNLKLQHSWEKEELYSILKELIQYHDSFRLKYIEENNTLIYKTFDNSFDLVEEYNLSGMDQKLQEQYIKKQKEALISKMDIQSGCLIRSCIFRNTNKGDLWFLLVHHIAIDAVSWRILLHHIDMLMKRKKEGTRYILPSKGTSYQEWCHNFYENIEDDQPYDTFCSPKYYGIAQKQSYPNILIMHLELDKNLTNLLVDKANIPYNTKTEDLLIAALARTMNELTGSNDILFELEHHGRGKFNDRFNVSSTIGWFTEKYPILISGVKNTNKQFILYVKEELYKLRKKNKTCQIREGWNYEDMCIRFNYLSDFHFQYIYFDAEFDERNLANDITCLIEVDCFTVKDKMNLYLKLDKNRFSKRILDNLLETIEKQIRSIIQLCISEKETVFSPSDFKYAELSMEDLDRIFE